MLGNNSVSALQSKFCQFFFALYFPLKKYYYKAFCLVLMVGNEFVLSWDSEQKKINIIIK